MKRTIARSLAAILAVTGLLGTSLQAQAGQASGTFNVNVTLNSACIVGTIGDVSGLTYNAFTTTDVTGSTTAPISCTNGLNYDLKLAKGSNPASTTSSVSTSALGLNYTVAIATPTGTGTGTAVNHAINVTIPKDQAGSCNSASCNVIESYTLYVNY